MYNERDSNLIIKIMRISCRMNFRVTVTENRGTFLRRIEHVTGHRK